MVSSACSGIQKPANQSKLGFSGAGALKKTGIHMQKVNRVPQHLYLPWVIRITFPAGSPLVVTVPLTWSFLNLKNQGVCIHFYSRKLRLSAFAQSWRRFVTMSLHNVKCGEKTSSGTRDLPQKDSRKSVFTQFCVNQSKLTKHKC